LAGAAGFAAAELPALAVFASAGGAGFVEVSPSGVPEGSVHAVSARAAARARRAEEEEA
jgi:hypothetical protein